MTMSDSKIRFSNRVEQYVRYRPGYPTGVLATLQEVWGLNPQSIIADIGSGTGLLAKLFLELGCRVYGVEPNKAMREAGEKLLEAYPRFDSIDASAESTGLQDGSIDFVTAGQAFHWFDAQAARREFLRILKPGGVAALVWNGRRIDSTPFLRDYELLLQKFGTDYNLSNHRNTEELPDTFPTFFGGPYRTHRFEYEQIFDYDGVAGRLLSSSYVPQKDEPAGQAMLAELKQIFDRHQQNGVIVFAYDTNMYSGRLAGE